MVPLLATIRVVGIFLCFKMLRGQIAKAVRPTYNLTLLPTFFKAPLIPDFISVSELARRGSVGYHKNACMTNTHHAAHSINRVYEGLEYETISKYPNFLPGITYWINDYLHVGHVHYDIVLLQVFQKMKVDRIIMQRSVCHGILCAGLGTMDSFYKGYYSAIFEAFNRSRVPVYVRWGREKEVSPLFFSAHTADNYIKLSKIEDESVKKPIPLGESMCFQKVLRRVDTHYGDIPVVSPSAVQQFKKAAYSLVKTAPPLKTYFNAGPPYVILFSHRGPQASRRISNQDEFIAQLQGNFSAPDFELRVLNNSDPTLTYQTQMRAVAEAHVVITNHGAFEGNMIYMRNGSLLLEIFGHYGNNEIHTFHRLALSFGVFYARLHAKTLTDHYAPEFQLGSNFMNNLVEVVQEYFAVKPWMNNLEPSAGLGKASPASSAGSSEAS